MPPPKDLRTALRKIKPGTLLHVMHADGSRTTGRLADFSDADIYLSGPQSVAFADVKRLLLGREPGSADEAPTSTERPPLKKLTRRKRSARIRSANRPTARRVARAVD